MKLIHCADIHLNSSLSTHLDGEKRKQRRTEILHTFLRMVDYAEEQSVDGILIAGDLFDTKKVDRSTGNAVISAKYFCFSLELSNIFPERYNFVRRADNPKKIK